MRCILIKIAAAFKPNGILHRKASNLWIVIPEKIIVQSGFTVSVLPDITQRLMSEGTLLCESSKSFGLAGNLAKALVVPAPPDLSHSQFTIHWHLFWA